VNDEDPERPGGLARTKEIWWNPNEDLAEMDDW
jgi:hypothetical protein